MSTNGIAELVADLVRLASHTEIVHHIPGRIRLRVFPSGLQALQRTQIGDINAIPGVKSIRVSPLVGSVVIEYDHVKLPPDIWESLGKLRRQPHLAPEAQTRLLALWTP